MKLIQSLINKVNKRNIQYDVLMILISSLSATIFFAIESERIHPEYISIFQLSRAFTFISCVFFFLRLIYDPKPTLSVIYFSIIMHLYAFVGIWLLPLYEISYIQVSIGLLFMKNTSSKTNQIISGIFLVFILVSYIIMDHIHWQRPIPMRSDYIFTALFFPIIVYCIYRYVILIERMQNEKNLRFNIIGQNANKILHDTELLLNKPLQTSKDFQKENKDPKTYAFMIYEEIKALQDQVKNMNRLVIPKNKIDNMTIENCINEAIRFIKIKFKNIQFNIIHCDQKLTADQDRMVSVFFNLILNSIEQFEIRRVENPIINIEFKNNIIHYHDNAMKTTNEINLPKKMNQKNSGLGIELIRHDLEMMNLKLDSQFDKNGYIYYIFFEPN